MVFQSRQLRRWDYALAAIFMMTGLMAGAQSAPEVSAVPPTATLRAGEPFEVGVAVSWTGDAGRFKVVPVEIEAPAWGEAAWDRVEARKTSDGLEQTFVARFTAKESGEFTVPGLRLNYIDPTEPEVEAPAAKYEGQPQSPGVVEADPSQPGAKLSVKAVYAGDPAKPMVPVLHPMGVEPMVVQVKADYRWAYPYIALGVVALGLLVALGSVWYGRRQAKAAAAPDPLAPWRTVEESLHNARRHRLDGDFYSYYREQLRIVQFVGGEVKSEFGVRLQKMVERVGFQGHTPTDDEIEGSMKDLERALARWKEGQAA